jgi:hypothetical protein
MRADHVLTFLGLLVIALVAIQFAWMGSNAKSMVERECALFYRPAGHDAEAHCRAEMLPVRSLSVERKSSPDDGPF